MNVMQKKREEIKQKALNDFKDHKITITRFGKDEKYFTAFCAKEGTLFYSFRVTIIPRAIIITGDCGDLLFSNTYGDRASVKWLRSAVKSESYLMEKASRVYRDQYEEFDEELAKEYIQELINSEDEDERELGLRIEKEWNDAISDDEPGRVWNEMMYEATGYDCEFNRAEDWNFQCLWLIEALKKFIELYDNEINKQKVIEK